MDGDALDDSVETAVLPFGVEKFKLAKLKEESAELVCLELIPSFFLYKAYFPLFWIEL